MTVAVEAAVYGIALARPRGWRLGVAVNLVSHPVGWLVLWPGLRTVLGPLPSLVLVEVAVWAFEWDVLRRFLPVDRARLAAVVLFANGASLLAGAVVPAPT